MKNMFENARSPLFISDKSTLIDHPDVPVMNFTLDVSDAGLDRLFQRAGIYDDGKYPQYPTFESIMEDDIEFAVNGDIDAESNVRVYLMLGDKQYQNVPLAKEEKDELRTLLEAKIIEAFGEEQMTPKLCIETFLQDSDRNEILLPYETDTPQTRVHSEPER